MGSPNNQPAERGNTSPNYVAMGLVLGSAIVAAAYFTKGDDYAEKQQAAICDKQIAKQVRTLEERQADGKTFKALVFKVGTGASPEDKDFSEVIVRRQADPLKLHFHAKSTMLNPIQLQCGSSMVKFAAASSESTIRTADLDDNRAELIGDTFLSDVTVDLHYEKDRFVDSNGMGYGMDLEAPMIKSLPNGG